MTNITTSTELIPREILFGNPDKTSPEISPDGTKMAYLAPVNNVLNVWVGTVGSDNYQPVTEDEDRGVRFYFWAQDNKHILYIQDVGGNENWRLYATSLENRETRDLTPFENVQAQIIKHDKHFPNELLIGMNKENPQVHDVYHLDLTSGELTLVAKNPGNIMGWVADAHFKVRSAITALPDGGSELLIREDEDAAWRTLVSWDADDSLTSSPVGFTLDGQSIYLQDSRNVNSGRLVKLNIATGDITVIAEDPQYDVGDVMIHPDTHEVQAVAFDKDRKEWLVLDESIKMDFDNIQGIHRGDFFVISRDDADITWIVAFTVDNGPVPFYAYDRKSQQATFLFDNQPALNKYTLATIEPISFTSRDGLTVHGYLTLPPGERKTNLPLVLNVHGGPWARDAWGYRPDAQWFANRGYACLQVNFRGSTGYGKDFLNAGNKEWGRNMHNDLVDAVQWAIDQGIADPKKVAIFGGSYGGYAALVGATFTPDLFCCAVDIVGPSNLITLIRTIPPYWSTFLATFHKRVGNPDTEEEFLKSRSPLFKVDQIKIPILIGQGANDPRVKQAESEQIVAAMKSKGIDYEYMLFPDEGHGFAKPENRLKFFAAAERFLAKHLGGRFEEAAEK
ncbi:MAG TPA: S9 family peptidase [Ktedonobacteraceae bacterium]|nr:S9 family peptidase [Ktedonobacteraceae bacterium]